MLKLLGALAATTALVACTTAPTSPVASASASPASAPAADVPAAKPQYGSFGFDAAGMDRAVQPGDDFYDFANGAWAKNTPIPQDRSNYGMFTLLDDLSTQRTHDILDKEANEPDSKIGALYASFMDEAAIEAKGFAPVKPQLAAIKAIATRADFAGALGAGQRDGVNGPIGLSVDVDSKNPDVPIVTVQQAGLGLPDRDYYLKNDAKLVAAKTAYAAYLAKLFELTGEGNGAARAQAIIAFETKLANAHWTNVANRDADKTYNPATRPELDKLAPGFDWTTFLDSAKLGVQPKYIVAQPSALAATARALAGTSLAVLKDYLLVQTLDGAAPYLAKPFVDANFAFQGTTLNGTPELRARWKRGVDLVKTDMGEAVGEQYVAQYFPPEAKAAADQLVKNVIKSMDDRLANLAWMAPETKLKARAKLAAFKPQIGYPVKWRDYSALQIDRNDLYGNVLRAARFNWDRGVAKLGKPADRDEWFMTPMEVNAYANPVWNQVVFPAAILQPPFFDPAADPAVNYGGIGAVIGHEISHHFDDQGRKYDMTGRLADWWTPQDVSRFTALTDKLVKQYDAYEPLPGVHVQGALTLGENMADLAGLTVAHEAYVLSLNGKPAPVIDGFTGDQRFYLGWAQVWRRSYREANLRNRLLTDPHSPAEDRANIVRNMDPWYDAFAPQPTAKLALPADQRVRVW